MFIYHISMDVEDPKATGLFLSKILDLNLREFYLDGVNLTHPSGTSLELIPRNTTISPSPKLFQADGSVSHDTSVHVSLTTPHSKDTVRALCAEAGWPCQDATRGPGLPLLEVHVENRYLFEIYAPEDRAKLDEFCANSPYYQRDPE
jgi:hypothetical protein